MQRVKMKSRKYPALLLSAYVFQKANKASQTEGCPSQRVPTTIQLYWVQLLFHEEISLKPNLFPRVVWWVMQVCRLAPTKCIFNNNNQWLVLHLLGSPIHQTISATFQKPTKIKGHRNQRN